jgi:hypothetical protein
VIFRNWVQFLRCQCNLIIMIFSALVQCTHVYCLFGNVY